MRSEPVEMTLLRHGETSFNRAGLYQGASDLPRPTQKGRAEAHAAAQLLVQAYDRLWVSPLSRASETADIVANARALPAPEPLPALREVDLPDWEGWPFDKVKELDGERHQCWKFTPSKFLMPRADGRPHHPANDALDRAREVLAKAQALPPGNRVLAVSHSGLIRAVLVAALGLDPDNLHAMRIDNCAVTKLALWPDGTARLTAFNRGANPPVWSDLDKAEPLRFVTDSDAVADSLCRVRCMGSTEATRHLDRPTDHNVARWPLAQIERYLGQVLGSPPEADPALSLRPGAVHVVLPRGPSDPARLWHLNLALPASARPKTLDTHDTR